MKYDNPAGRLLEVLTAVSSFEKTTDARAVWRSVFALPKGESSYLLSAMLAKTMLLAHDAIVLLEVDHPELASPTPSWVVQVSHAFQTHNVHGTIESFKNSISTETLANIRITAALLDKGSKRKVLSTEELTEMREQINAVLTDVLASDIEEGLKSYVARALRKILTAIDEYKLGGAQPILESVEQAAGHVMVDPSYRSFLKDAALGQRVLDALQAAGGIVTVATGLPVLAHAAQLFLK